jgi:protein ImuB
MIWSSTMRRYLCIWFPDWPLERLARHRRRQGTAATGARPDDPACPFALIEAGAHGLSIVAANRAARTGGVVPGLGFSDAMARLPRLESEEIDRAGDRLALRRLAGWMGRYSPLVARHGSDGLMLETTGCDHLFGGEDAMAAEISDRLDALGLTARIGLAGTQGAAHALARAAPESPAILAPGEEHDGLAGLAVSALRLEDASSRLLRRFGLNRIGQLYGVDRRALARRFASREAAEAVVMRLDQALGLRGEPLAPIRPAPAHSARLACPEPLLHREGVWAGLERLLGEACRELAWHGRGARGFRLAAYRSDGSVSCVSVRAARPVRAPGHALRLFGERLDEIDPGFGIDLMVLEAFRPDSMHAGRPVLSAELAGHTLDMHEVSALADRIMARLGEGAVQVAVPQSRHIPEQAERLVSFKGELADWPARDGAGADRPLRLFARPEPVEVLAEVPDGPPIRFVWRRMARRVARADGPERIAPEWWMEGGTSLPTPVPVHEVATATTRPERDPSPSGAERAGAAQPALSATHRAAPAQRAVKRTRDYYRIEDEAGRRYWVFRDGLYGDGRGGAPQWYVHGVFA